ncbi:MAG: hypothetical protein RR065_09005 [Clostridia bacterium]
MEVVETFNASELIRELRGMGLEIYVGSDRTVHGRMAGGRAIPRAAWALIDRLRMVNEEAVKLIEPLDVVELHGISVEDTLALKERVNAGEIEIVNIVYHKAPMVCDVKYREVNARA